MKINLCDVCMAEGKLTMAVWKVRERVLRITIYLCHEHKQHREPASEIVMKAERGYQGLYQAARERARL